ncbi:hypothetical protein [Sinorhizobium sp. GL28]|uniref:hypothetical protein n=1 Tax=Sinorhizobium sp. GL28 TaxID=1358418 RepID=UPI0018D26B21|nr:hypothetical protein [Sinorhizobium sp. GL28]
MASLVHERLVRTHFVHEDEETSQGKTASGCPIASSPEIASCEPSSELAENPHEQSDHELWQLPQYVEEINEKDEKCFKKPLHLEISLFQSFTISS